MTLSHEKLVEDVAKKFYDAEPLRDQDTDEDGRPVGAAFSIPWEHLSECDEGLYDWNIKVARAILDLIHSALSEVTPEMVEAWLNTDSDIDALTAIEGATMDWLAMLSASPLSPGEKG